MDEKFDDVLAEALTKQGIHLGAEYVASAARGKTYAQQYRDVRAGGISILVILQLIFTFGPKVLEIILDILDALKTPTGFTYPVFMGLNAKHGYNITQIAETILREKNLTLPVLPA